MKPGDKNIVVGRTLLEKGLLGVLFLFIHMYYTDGDPDMEADFYILRHTTAPAVLTENFFMDSHPDCAFLFSEEGQNAIVSLHVTGITAYLSTL